MVIGPHARPSGARVRGQRCRRRHGANANASQRGMALVLALVILALGLAVGAAIAGNLMRATLLLRRQAETVEISALIDAGMAQALAELSKARTWTGDELRLPVGSVSMAAEKIGAHDYRVELAAHYRRRIRRVEATVRIRPMSAPEVTEWRPVLGVPSPDADPR